MITTLHIATQVTFHPVLGQHALFHPSVGRLELGMSSYFKWRAMPLLRESQSGYHSSAGLYTTWQREDHALELMIRQAIEDMDNDPPPAEPTDS